MTRKEKEQEVTWLREQFSGVKLFFLTDFQGLTVAEMNDLRSQLRNEGATYKVLKNTLVRRAYTDTSVELIGDSVIGPRGAAWTTEEEKAPDIAKVLVEFTKGHPKLELVRGVLNREIVEPQQLEALSKLPSKDELRARLLGTMIAPIGAVVNTLAAIPRSFLNVLKAVEQQKSEAPEQTAS